MEKVLNFKDFHKKFPYLDIEELIIYYSIFNGHPLIEKIDLSKDFYKIIEKEIIEKVDILRKFFIYDKKPENQEIIEKILSRISKGDRKSYSTYSKDNISQPKGREFFKYLFETGIIKKELSREKPLKNDKKQILKKRLRRYKIEDKIHINNNFTRFWFTFIHPFLKENREISLKNIKIYLDKFISLEFEKLSILLIEELHKKEKILTSGSYWDKDIEIDLLIETSLHKFAGEVKWKNSKTCKNILNSLQSKCKLANLPIDKYLLFSKSGFSNELKSKKYPNVILYELKDFEYFLY